MQPATTYFLSAIETLRKNKEQYAAAEARARPRHPVRPSYFDAMDAMGAMDGMEAMGVEISDLPNFPGTERVTSVIVQARPNDYQP